ncbi:L-aspartate oxidase [Sporosarcina sp. ACRSM]|uniref:L-aspartate oxidase n=1 Tax=Sporosarcina sp. ACRSM TaxID=2918216 RepID=UPI001EF739A4|nr:L-aspartate oxidase [Sporosarcina sp. ACRSM]MCG7334742.1 L-aspartate oxidase [Sporosarcina sp. ACRSM]
MKTYRCIIVGSGIAALQLATHLSTRFPVLLITKSSLRSSNSYRAQGGIAAAIGGNDAPSLHYEDTIHAGCDFHNEKEVRDLVEKGPSLINELTQSGLRFDENPTGQFSLGMEGAHSQNRIVHCGGDATGKHVIDHLMTTLSSHIDVLENRLVYELVIHPLTKKCIGVKVKDNFGNNEVYWSDHVVLATGGVGGLYSFTSNDPSITGDGIALAYQVGAEIVDMEFIQFHPTLLYVNGQTAGLISEAVRGEGARLVDAQGNAIMEDVHPLGDLAPRHIVAGEIFRKKSMGRDVYLDISMINAFEEKFPTITAICQAQAISIEDGKIPVAPGCHFLMGGIAVDTVGRTSVEGLYAIGETAATGVHGANRLASNSLLEGLHYGKKLAAYLNEQMLHSQPEPMKIDLTKRTAITNYSLPDKQQLRGKMMAYAGIIRCQSELEQLRAWLNDYDSVRRMDCSLDESSSEDIQLLFMVQTAKLIAHAALLREESRGAHKREDFPEEDERLGKIHIVQSKKGIEMRERHCEYDQVEVHA